MRARPSSAAAPDTDPPALSAGDGWSCASRPDGIGGVAASAELLGPSVRDFLGMFASRQCQFGFDEQAHRVACALQAIRHGLANGFDDLWGQRRLADDLIR